MEPIKIHCAYDKMLPIEKLIPNPANPNTHSEKHLIHPTESSRVALTGVLRREGYMLPIIRA